MAIAPRERGVELGETAPQLFLSHSSKDQAAVYRLAQLLNICGVDVWLDTWELRVGDDLHERISDAIDKSRYVGVAVSRHFDDGRWVRGEVHQALSREMGEDRTVVLPLMLEDVPSPPVLSRKKFLPFHGEEYYPSLVRLAALVNDLPTADVESGIASCRPTDLSSALDALGYADFHPFCVVDKKTLDEIERLGGDRDGDRVYFSLDQILEGPQASRSLKDLMIRLSGQEPAA